MKTPKLKKSFRIYKMEYKEPKKRVTKNDKKQKSIMISAKTRQNLPDLKNLIYEEALIEHLKIYPNYIQPQTF